MDDYLRWVPPEYIPIDRSSWLSVACVALGGIAWLVAALIAWLPYVIGDIASIIIGNHYERPGLVAGFVSALLSSQLLDAAAFWLGRRSRRRIRNSAGALRGRLIAWLGMASAAVLFVLLVALVLVTIQATQAEYNDMVRCAQPGACINP